jgi:hypothetical protein
LVAAACGVESASCVTECENLESTCPEDAPGYLSCVGNAENQVSCVDGGVSVAGCNPENQAISVCLVCEPLADDTGCGSCIKTNCCAELETYVGSSDVTAFDLCAAECADQACIDACVVSSPAAGAAYEEIITCEDASCLETCRCEVATDDSACLACGKTNCCTELVAYSQSSDLTDFTACADACLDDACIDACVGEAPIAGAAYSDYVACLSTPCAADCAP